MRMTVGERRFAITWADNEAARAFAAMLPLTLGMPDPRQRETRNLPESAARESESTGNDTQRRPDYARTLWSFSI